MGLLLDDLIIGSLPKMDLFLSTEFSFLTLFSNTLNCYSLIFDEFLTDSASNLSFCIPYVFDYLVSILEDYLYVLLLFV